MKKPLQAKTRAARIMCMIADGGTRHAVSESGRVEPFMTSVSGSGCHAVRCSRRVIARPTDAWPPPEKKCDPSAGQARIVDKLATHGTAFPSSLDQSGGPRQSSVAYAARFTFNAQHEGLPFAGCSPNAHGKEVYPEGQKMTNSPFMRRRGDVARRRGERWRRRLLRVFPVPNVSRPLPFDTPRTLC